MHHYPHHVSDFKSATCHITFVERALYRELLDLYYDTERPLVADQTKLARLARAETDEHKAALQSVLDEFFVLTDEGWFNERCAREIEAYQQKQEQQSRAGKASAAKRKAKRPAPAAPKGGAGAAPVGDVGGDAGSTGVERPLNGRATNQNQNQNQYQKETSSPKDGGGDAVLLSDAVVPKSEHEWAAVFADEFGVEVDPYSVHQRKKFNPLSRGWIAAKVSLGAMRAAVQRARSDATEGIAYLPGYVDRVLASMSAPPPESKAEAAARARMQQAAPLAAAHAPAPAATAGVDGYSFFQQAAQSRELEVV